MADEYTRREQGERPDFWANHLFTKDDFEVITLEQMWPKLEKYVSGGKFDDE